MRRHLLGPAVLVAAIASWELWARSRPSFLLAPFSVVAERAWAVWPTGEFLSGVAASLERLAAGYVIGSVVGISTGLLLGASPRARRTLEPLTEILRAIPPIALVPVAVVILDVGDATAVAVIAFGVTFPVLINTIEGVRSVPPEARDTAAVLGVERAERLFRIYLPAALPSIFAGLRVAVSIGLLLVVLSELVAGTGDGLGSYIETQQSRYNVPELYGGLLFLGLLGYLLNRLFLVAERRILHWHFGAADELAG